MIIGRLGVDKLGVLKYSKQLILIVAKFLFLCLLLCLFVCFSFLTVCLFTGRSTVYAMNISTEERKSLTFSSERREELIFHIDTFRSEENSSLNNTRNLPQEEKSLERFENESVVSRRTPPSNHLSNSVCSEDFNEAAFCHRSPVIRRLKKNLRSLD